MIKKYCNEEAMLKIMEKSNSSNNGEKTVAIHKTMITEAKGDKKQQVVKNPRIRW